MKMFIEEYGLFVFIAIASIICVLVAVSSIFSTNLNERVYEFTKGEMDQFTKITSEKITADDIHFEMENVVLEEGDDFNMSEYLEQVKRNYNNGYTSDEQYDGKSHCFAYALDAKEGYMTIDLSSYVAPLWPTDRSVLPEIDGEPVLVTTTPKEFDDEGVIAVTTTIYFDVNWQGLEKRTFANFTVYKNPELHSIEVDEGLSEETKGSIKELYEPESIDKSSKTE